MPINNSKISEEVYEILKNEVLSGQYLPGERMPSERDIAKKFEVSRGVARESFKKLHQLGLISIESSGSRVVSIKKCTLDCLGPLLDLNKIPDPKIMDEVLDIGFYLIDLAVPMAISKNKKLLIEKIKDLKVKKNLNPRELFFIFAEASDHLVLLFITNGLKKELLGRLEAVGYAPKYDQVIITKLLSDLEDSIRKKDMPKSIKLLKGAFNFTREELKKNLDQMIMKNRT